MAVITERMSLYAAEGKRPSLASRGYIPLTGLSSWNGSKKIG